MLVSVLLVVLFSLASVLVTGVRGDIGVGGGDREKISRARIESQPP